MVLSAVFLTGCGKTGENTGGTQRGVSSNTAVPAGNEPPVQPLFGWPETLVVADFDSGEKPNNVGGNFGAWDKDPRDISQWCADTFDSTNRYGQKGFCIKLDYDVDSRNPAYNGFWMLLQALDASPYDSISFWVKGDEGAGYTSTFKIELKNAKKQVGAYYVTGITGSWQNMVIPLNKIRGITDFSGLTEFVVVFEDKVASDKDGAIYIDEVAFIRNE